MKRLFLLTMFSILVLIGCDESPGGGTATASDNPKPVGERRSSWWESENSKLKRQIEQYKQQIENLEAQLKSSQQEKAVVEKDRDAALAGKKKSNLWLGIIFGTIGCVVLVALFWIGKLLFVSHGTVATSEDLDSCPRCGMERTPGESVCRECGTHF